MAYHLLQYDRGKALSVLVMRCLHALLAIRTLPAL
jgi:hypothetical protein